MVKYVVLCIANIQYHIFNSISYFSSVQIFCMPQQGTLCQKMKFLPSLVLFPHRETYNQYSCTIQCFQLGWERLLPAQLLCTDLPYSAGGTESFSNARGAHRL